MSVRSNLAPLFLREERHLERRMRPALAGALSRHVVPYPVRKRWSKVFRPHRDAVMPTVQAAVELLDPTFLASQDIPRELGWTLDCAWPRSRTGAMAYQCFGYCHHAAAYMLDFARRGLPGERWWILNAEAHSVVVSETAWLIDINCEDPGHLDGGKRSELADAAAFHRLVRQPFAIYGDLESYLTHLRANVWLDESTQAAASGGAPIMMIVPCVESALT